MSTHTHTHTFYHITESHRQCLCSLVHSVCCCWFVLFSSRSYIESSQFVLSSFYLIVTVVPFKIHTITSNTIPIRMWMNAYERACMCVCMHRRRINRIYTYIKIVCFNLFGAVLKQTKEYLSTMCALTSISGWTVNEWQSLYKTRHTHTHTHAVTRQSILNKFT